MTAVTTTARQAQRIRLEASGTNAVPSPDNPQFRFEPTSKV
jgi:hypothetical protein